MPIGKRSRICIRTRFASRCTSCRRVWTRRISAQSQETSNLSPATGARLTIVGRAPTPAVKKLADAAGIVVTGRVDDVRPYMREASVYVVPLRIGGGTRLKIFEAMAMGKAVVSTTIGAEGLPVTNGTHVMVADDPASFARAVVVLIRDADRRQQLEVAARALVVEKYDWSAVAGELEIALARFAGRRAGEINPCKSPSLVLDT